MTDPKAIEAKLCLYAGLDQDNVSHAQAKTLREFSIRISIIGSRNHPIRDMRPDILEGQLEEIRRSIRTIIRQIENIDLWALALARRAKLHKEIEAAEFDQDRIIEIIKSSEQIPMEQWTDLAAIRNLKLLDEGLRYPIEILIEKSRQLPSGRGTKPNIVARRIALLAANALIQLTKRPVTYWKASTSYARLTADLFESFGIKADTRRACEWALSELPESEEF